MELITLKEAKESGLKFYFTGIKCKHGHISKRYVTNRNCHECNNMKGKQYYKDNKEKQLEYDKEYRSNNKESVKLRKQKYREQNKERINDVAREYYNNNKDKFKEARVRQKQKTKARARKYYIENRELLLYKNKEYYINNKGTVFAKCARRRASKHNAIVSWIENEIERIKEIYNECHMMSNTCDKKYHVDHVIPLQHNLVCGLHCVDNLQIIPAEENLRKSNMFEIL
jgi:hypothetical protein